MNKKKKIVPNQRKKPVGKQTKVSTIKKIASSSDNVNVNSNNKRKREEDEEDWNQSDVDSESLSEVF